MAQIEEPDECSKSKCSVQGTGMERAAWKNDPSVMGSCTHVTKENHIQCPIPLYPVSLRLYSLPSFTEIFIKFLFFAIIPNVLLWD